MQFIFQPKLTEIPADLSVICEKLISCDFSFVQRLSGDATGQQKRVMMLHNFPSWLQKGTRT